MIDECYCYFTYKHFKINTLKLKLKKNDSNSIINAVTAIYQTFHITTIIY